MSFLIQFLNIYIYLYSLQNKKETNQTCEGADLEHTKKLGGRTNQDYSTSVFLYIQVYPFKFSKCTVQKGHRQKKKKKCRKKMLQFCPLIWA